VVECIVDEGDRLLILALAMDAREEHAAEAKR
jgi:hypothetical protein